MRWTSVVPLLGLVACGGGGTPDWHRFVRPEDETFALAYFDSVRFERFDYAVRELSPLLAGIPGVRDSLVSVARLLPHGALDSMHLIGVNRVTSSSIDRSDLSYEYHSANGWGAASIVVLVQDGQRLVHGFRAEALSRPLEATNAFTLHDKGLGGPAAPWILQVAFPIGAILTLRHVRGARQTPTRPAELPPPATPASTEASET